jgi:hypothetical protein
VTSLRSLLDLPDDALAPMRIVRPHLVRSHETSQRGVALNSVLLARMDPDNPNSRSAPADWQAVLARMARKRSKAFQLLAEQLEREGVNSNG